MLRHFRHDHLPSPLADVSRHFALLAGWITSNIADSEQRRVSLQKLLEAKDAAVRAKLEEKTDV